MGSQGLNSLKDHAGKIVGTMDLGGVVSMLMTFAPSGAEGAITDKFVEKIKNTVEAYNKVAEQTYEFAEKLDEKRAAERANEAIKNLFATEDLEAIKKNTNEPSSSPTTSSTNTKPAPVEETIIKGPSGVKRDPNTKKVTQYSTSETKTVSSNNSTTPDTIRTVKYQKPKE